MKPSQNALIGYSYQKTITMLLLGKMDAERRIDKIEIEKVVNNKFDDALIEIDESKIFCQFKDIDQIELKDIVVEGNSILIKGSKHELSEHKNVLFFKSININPNCNIIGFDAYDLKHVLIISMSREESLAKLEELYEVNETRIGVINRFFEKCLDERKLDIYRAELPIIELFITELLEETIKIGKYHLEDENLIHLEGKPGIGKSHLVNCLCDEYTNHIIYRFWISNQDKDYKKRLEYTEFIFNISKEIFNDYIRRDVLTIIAALVEKETILIIDGLDHVENYNAGDLPLFIEFINEFKKQGKIIVLSRPLKVQVDWEKKVIENWTKDQTFKVIKELYHIADYSTGIKIYEITAGYPILVRYISEHYKQFKSIPQLEKLDSIDEYYSKIIKSVNTKSALSLFLCSRSFFMKSEINDLLDGLASVMVNEFINDYPYLFEIRLNRITLVHDSFNTYLRNTNENLALKEEIQDKVYASIMDGNSRYLSRLIFFELGYEHIKAIIKKYSSISFFESYARKTIDFEALREFYQHIRESLQYIKPKDLAVREYYDLALILNIVNRDHVSTLHNFYYTYSKSLIFHGFTMEDITSSEYLFCTFYYMETGDMSLVYNLTSNKNYGTERFYEEFQNHIREEEGYFIRHQKSFEDNEKILELLDGNMEYGMHDVLVEVLANVYIHQPKSKELIELYNSISEYINGNTEIAIDKLKNRFPEKDLRDFSAGYLLKKAVDKIESLGGGPEPNMLRALTLSEYIQKYSGKGSFNMWVKVLNYIRLALHEKRKIDIDSIGLFWPMYHERKDYTVINIDEALKVFEDYGIISEVDSINLIIYTQSLSEKGIRHLLTNYITLHNQDILKILEDNFHIEDLNIDWENLPSNFIEVYSKEIFYNMISELLRQNSYSKTIKFRELKNIYNSNKSHLLFEILKYHGFSVEIPANHPQTVDINKLGINIILDKEKDRFSSKETSAERINKGMIYMKDIGYAMRKGILPSQIAGFVDGNYSLFTNVDIYDSYKKEDIVNNALEILFNALQGKIHEINMYGNVYCFVGNVPKFLSKYGVIHDKNDIFNSFIKFLEISLIWKK